MSQGTAEASLDKASVDEAGPKHVVHMPCWREIGGKVLRTVTVVSILPMAVFYIAMACAGVIWAVGVTLGWYWAGMGLRLLRRKRVYGGTLLGAGLLSVRATVMFCTGNPFIYFVQPIAGTLVTALVFAGSAIASRPLMDRLAHDFCPLPEAVSERLRGAKFFGYLSLLWAMVYAINAAGTLWLLTNAPLGGFLVIKTIASPILTGIAAALSYLMFRFVMRRDGVIVRWGATASAAPIPLAVPVPA
jgi:hypothetical protein